MITDSGARMPLVPCIQNYFDATRTDWLAAKINSAPTEQIGYHKKLIWRQLNQNKLVQSKINLSVNKPVGSPKNSIGTNWSHIGAILY